MTSPAHLSLPFVARGRAGTVSVSVSRNDDPASYGCSPAALGLAVCRATVEFEADGYDALLGWVQTVGERSAQSDERVHTADPLDIYAELETPFGFYGLEPTLFDAPSRRDRNVSLDWLAHSFLCVAPTSPMAREAKPVAGFSWGFTIEQGHVDIFEPLLLTPSAWTDQHHLLRTNYPSWDFLDADW
jgi:hypothetical protein